MEGTFYWWDVGGAPNTEKVISMLKDLGFKKITIIYDNNMRHLIDPLKTKFLSYHFICIPTDEIRTKKKRNEKPAVEGLVDEGGRAIDPRYDGKLDNLFKEINHYLS